MEIKSYPSPNCSTKTRPKKNIKFVIIHYTGMQSEIESIKRMMDVKSKVSCHYLISRKGKIIQMVEDNKVAWHAGKSKWKNFINLNNNSIGIELVNKGLEFGYQNFTDIQIINLIKLCRNLKKKYLLKKENFLGHSDIAPLRKKDPGEKFPWKRLNKYKIGCWHKINGKKLKLIRDKNYEKFFFTNLNKIGYRYFSFNKKSKKNKSIIKAFQQHFLPQEVTGKIDQKTLKISHFLAFTRKLT